MTAGALDSSETLAALGTPYGHAPTSPQRRVAISTKGRALKGSVAEQDVVAAPA